MYHAPIRFPFTSLLFRKVIRDSRGFRIIPDFLSPELNWIQQASIMHAGKSKLREKM